MKATYFAAAAAVALAGVSGTAHSAVSISAGLNEPFTYDFRGTDPDSVSALADEGVTYTEPGFGPVVVEAAGNLSVTESLTQSSAGLGVGVTPVGGLNEEIDANFLTGSESITLTFTSPRSLREVGITKAGTDTGLFSTSDTDITVTTPEGTQTLTSSTPSTAAGQLSTLVFSDVHRDFETGRSFQRSMASAVSITGDVPLAGRGVADDRRSRRRRRLRPALAQGRADRLTPTRLRDGFGKGPLRRALSRFGPGAPAPSASPVRRRLDAGAARRHATARPNSSTVNSISSAEFERNPFLIPRDASATPTPSFVHSRCCP